MKSLTTVITSCSRGRCFGLAETLLFGASARETQVTLAMLNDNQWRWQAELMHTRGTPGSPFSADPELRIVSVSLQDESDDKIRNSLLRVPTAFTIEAREVMELWKAGAQAASFLAGAQTAAGQSGAAETAPPPRGRAAAV